MPKTYSKRRVTKRSATHLGLPVYRTKHRCRLQVRYGSDHEANLTAVLEHYRTTGLCFNDESMVVGAKAFRSLGTSLEPMALNQSQTR